MAHRNVISHFAGPEVEAMCQLPYSLRSTACKHCKLLGQFTMINMLFRTFGMSFHSFVLTVCHRAQEEVCISSCFGTQLAR